MPAVSTIVMPKIGLTMTEGVLASWNVGPGDEVREGDVIFVVETDKIATEVTARAAGKIDTIKVTQGETVPVGSVVATWTGPATGAEDHDIDNIGEAQGTGNDLAPQASAISPQTRRTRIVATPQARRLARSLGLDLRKIKGSGPGGRIKASDLPQPNTVPDATNIAAEADAPKTPEPAAAAGKVRRPLSSIERTVARRLTAAKREIPHFYVMAEANLSRLMELRTELNADTSKSKISVNHLMLLATGRALLKNPDFNVIWDSEELVTLTGSDVGFAVDTPQGLYAPVLRGVGTMRIDELAEAASGVAERARRGNLRPEDLSGGAITVSNVGMYGASWIVPIINPGQSAIIGVGATKAQFRPDSAGAPALCEIVSLVLSGDHRVLDGVKGARLLNAVINLLEHPLDLIR
jgi:pyruvate dehydrogenase E2 component (dihydrolipoamide acetyltransferase)